MESDDLRRSAQSDRHDCADGPGRPYGWSAFEAYVTRVLLPALMPGDILVMNNLAAHKRAEIGVAIEAAGAQLLYLPPYSDLNPIEMPSQTSKQRFERPPPDQSRLWTMLSPSPCPPSPPKSASIFFAAAGMIASDQNLL